MARSTQPSIPPSAPAPFRHLGARRVSERPARLQLGIALGAGLILLAVPLYLWRRPTTGEGSEPARTPLLTDRLGVTPAIGAGSGTLSPLLGPGSVPHALTGTATGAPSPPVASPGKGVGVSLSEAKVVRCTKLGARKASLEPCDRQPFFEEALMKAVRDNTSCAPSVAAGGTVNFVLDVDHPTKKLRVWPGRSGTLGRKAVKDIVGCVSRGLPSVEWTQLPHQHAKYQISLLATYPAGPWSAGQ